MMKALHRLIVLYLVSNITLVSEDCAVCVSVSVGLVAITPLLYTVLYPSLPFDSKRE